MGSDCTVPIDDERIKIRCAKKHFEAVNESVDEIVKYDWVKAFSN